ncbi:hypothetical protein HYT25_00785 [Candidatus Pacearchaeota archaeon]|nr:hypothetical protein [Candidatus Pacearchaeota archaeon]
MFKIATLIEVESLPVSLEVHVQNKDFKDKKDAKSNARNTLGQTSRGSICFNDDRSPGEIVEDFARTYQTPTKIGSTSKSYFVTYDKRLDIIPLAFVHYFSTRTK